MTRPIIAALDVPTSAEALALVDKLWPLIGTFKIGSELFTTAGPDVVRAVRERGANVFLDLKFHDIPNTVAQAVAAVTRLDVQMLTVHISGGTDMLEAADQAAQNAASAAGRPAPLILGVTILTSLESQRLSEIGMEANVGRQVERLASLAARSGLKGLVCSPLEVVSLRQILPSDFVLVTPGIRAEREKLGDQKRTLSASEALAAGADWLVIGRPIYAAPDPRAAAEKIIASLG